MPKEIRDLLGLNAGSILDFLVLAYHTITARTVKPDARRIRGLLKSPHPTALSVAQMDEGIAFLSSKQNVNSMIGIDTNLLLRLWLNDALAQNKRIDSLLGAYGQQPSSLLVTDVCSRHSDLTNIDDSRQFKLAYAYCTNGIRIVGLAIRRNYSTLRLPHSSLTRKSLFVMSLDLGQAQIMGARSAIDVDLADVWAENGRKKLLRTLAWGDEVSGDENSRKEYIHPRATLVGALGEWSRVPEPLIFVTEMVAFFKVELKEAYAFQLDDTGNPQPAKVIRA